MRDIVTKRSNASLASPFTIELANEPITGEFVQGSDEVGTLDSGVCLIHSDTLDLPSHMLAMAMSPACVIDRLFVDRQVSASNFTLKLSSGSSHPLQTPSRDRKSSTIHRFAPSRVQPR
ncbi:hypothetical protein PILCRDRAFT_824119 [Piloderma croceum F 1598]|uniref:Uncharacterized protein n=1 Tax=Piloderma croceum (strain F 1598) TaxID=765440 RepID=A0A0C3F1Q0_PILCF|nr:hypothetical protein PILCRDRAFT_824119 [Piloderma croceum F 1598]